MPQEQEYVSRAGLKLKHAIDHFNINVAGKVCADLGSSTGGFVDCLLQEGASKVYSVDTAYGELAWKLRKDPRVVVMERTNALHVEIPEKVDFISIDVGWTKQEKIIPVAMGLLKEGGEIVSLVKPHYEADRRYIVKGKLQDEHISEVMDQVIKKIESLGVEVVGTVESPITGKRANNREFCVYLSSSD